MKIEAQTCTDCGCVRFTLAAMQPCTHPSTFHSWTVNRG